MKINAVGINNIFTLFTYVTRSVTIEFIASAEQVEIRQEKNLPNLKFTNWNKCVTFNYFKTKTIAF